MLASSALRPDRGQLNPPLASVTLLEIINTLIARSFAIRQN